MSDATYDRNEHNVAEYLLKDKDPSAIAILLPQSEYSYGDIRTAVDKLATFFHNCGCRKGDRVLLIGENSYFWIVSYLAILRANLVCVPLAPKISRDDLEFIIASSGSRAAAISVDVFSRNRDLLNGLQILTNSAPAGATNHHHVTSFDAVLQDTQMRARTPERTHPHNLAALMFTSGSTAKPRGVMITHGNIIANTESIIEYLELTKLDRIMAVLPFHYCFGTSLLHTHLKVGASVVVENRFMYPEIVLERMRQTGCTGFAGVPSHFQILLRRSTFIHHDLPTLRYLQQAGGHLAPTFIRKIREAFPKVEMFVMYGQTEATARLAYLPPKILDKKIGSIGKGIPGVILRVLNESGRDVAVGEIGEIVAEGDNIAAGYWQDELATAASFRDGKLYTGDMATVDEDGYIFVVDRAQDFLKCGGKRVSCHVVQDTMLEFEDVLEVAVIGVPDPVLGEAVRAFVVPRHSEDTNFEEKFAKFCREHLQFQLVPRSLVVMKELPKSNGKVMKHALRQITIPEPQAPAHEEVRAATTNN